jgi:nicotinamidase-related amidase
MTTATTRVPAYIARWFDELPPLLLSEAVPDPSRAALFSADMMVGFCARGNLASERVGALATPVAALFHRAYRHGIRHFVLLQDTHHPQTPEFDTFPSHCMQGTEEAATIPQLRELPFSDLFTIIEKNSLHPALGTEFDRWLDEHQEVDTALVVENCTDLCVYQLAMHLRLRANALNRTGFQVFVSARAVDTYHLPEKTGGKLGTLAHPADFFHQVFLYHLALNGIRVVWELI